AEPPAGRRGRPAPPRPAGGPPPMGAAAGGAAGAAMGGAADASGAEATRITEALGGPASGPSAPPGPSGSSGPSAPPAGPQAPAGHGAPASGPAPGRAGGPPHAKAPGRPAPDPDLEATTQHAAVPAEPGPQGGDETVVARVPAAKPPERDASEDDGSGPDATVLARPVGGGSADKTSVVAALGTDAKSSDAKAKSEADVFDDFDDDDEDDDNDEVRAIDATLARFSAVHDQIAEEEAERRKKYAWLFGKRREPELGTDMPFDYVEGRDAGASRVEWKRQQRKRRTGLIVKALAVAAALTIFVTIGTMWGAKTWVDGKFREVASLDPNSGDIKDAAKQTGDQNFLLIGSDTRAGATADDGVGNTEDEPGARADTTMIAHIPADRSRVVVVSFPRDLEVAIPACERWDAATGRYTGVQAPAQEKAKLNQAYAVGGPKCTTKVIQQLSGLSITSFLGIDFQGFKSMVDAVHGVDICTQKPVVDDVIGTVLPNPGHYNLTGQQALSYVRARHVQGDVTADYGRMQRQQLFLSALLRKTMSSQVLLDPNKLSGFVNAVAANTFGENVGTDRLLELGQSMQGLDPSKVTFVTVPTTGYANDDGREELRAADNDALFRAIIEGVPVTPPASGGGTGGSTPSGGTGPMATAFTAHPLPAIQPSQVKVEVVNTTGSGGSAGTTGDRLREFGFNVTGTGQSGSSASGTVIKHSPANAEAAKLLASSVPGARLVEDASAGSVLRLELGAGFDGAVHAPSTAPAQVPENLATVNAGTDVCAK
ncbi:LCP family protein, partial [Saccharopolyspora erythraea]